MKVSNGLERQLRAHFEAGKSIAEVRAIFREIPWAFIADAFFGVRAVAQLRKSAVLSEALAAAGAAHGQSREGIALRVLESIARAGLIDAAMRGALMVVPPILTAPLMAGARP